MSNELVSAHCLSSRLICAGENPHTLPMYARTQPWSRAEQVAVELRRRLPREGVARRRSLGS